MKNATVREKRTEEIERALFEKLFICFLLKLKKCAAAAAQLGLLISGGDEQLWSLAVGAHHWAGAREAQIWTTATQSASTPKDCLHQAVEPSALAVLAARPLGFSPWGQKFVEGLDTARLLRAARDRSPCC